MKVHVLIDNKLYKISKEDAEKLDKIPLNQDDGLDEVMAEIEEKYKPVDNFVRSYNYG